jgi:hypothetical protein
MSDAVVCHGARLFGQVLPPFVLAEGGLMIVKTHTVTRQAEYARLLFCEALCETVVVEGIEVFQPFEVVHPCPERCKCGRRVRLRMCPSGLRDSDRGSRPRNYWN